MQIYHEIWLQAHPWRTREWLQEKLNDGFDIHHIDGNKKNNKPDNLLLCDASDHMHLHGMPLRDMARKAAKPKRKRIRIKPTSDINPDKIYRKIGRLHKLLRANGHL
jgi:hypothetical protein